MVLEQAEWRDILTILHETSRIWSCGLATPDYYDYTWLQMTHCWGRQNYRYLVYKELGQVVAGCKLYNLTMTARGRQYGFRGISAVYTREKFRGKHLAKAMIDEVIEMCTLEDIDGILLFSDIGPDYYQSLGFVELGSANFSVTLEENRHSSLSLLTPEIKLATTEALSHKHASWTAPHYQRWLRYQPFGMQRSTEYWHYKISRENFLQEHSRLSWPTLQITRLELDSKNGGYAITEVGGGVMRILEVIGSERARQILWLTLFERAFACQYHLIRGWESVIRDFEPNYKLSKLLPPGQGLEMAGQLLYTERDWGRCMILPMNDGTEEWLSINPCPLLELDYL